ncbi:MAG: CpaF family protein [Firmicutes bacterium]|nr:CpaF family protein [Bacillota bacterium]
MKEFMKDMLEQVRFSLAAGDGIDDEAAMELIVTTVFSDERSEIYSIEELDQVIKRLFYKTRCRLGILQPLMEEQEVTEIMVNGAQNIFVEREGVIERYGLSFDSNEEIEEIMRAVAAQVHREVNELQPIVDARLEDGSRVSGVYKNVAINGPTLTIRKFSERYMTLKHLIQAGTITPEGGKLLTLLVICGYNIFISGGTSSGKTTFLNALAEYIPKEERVIVIEDSSELKLNQVENVVHLECRNSNASGKGQVDMSRLIKASLRMRPDRIIVGEVRGGEVLDMVQAMNTGHSGSLCTGHGNSVEGMLRRLETMYMMAMPITIEAIRSQIGEAIDIMVHMEKMEDGRRRVVEITEVIGYRKGEFILNPLMKLLGGREGTLTVTGNSLSFSRRAVWKGDVYADQLRNMGLIRNRLDHGDSHVHGNGD